MDAGAPISQVKNVAVIDCRATKWSLVQSMDVTRTLFDNTE